MKSLETRIAELNAKSEAWVAEDPKNRWVGLLSNDVKHWNDMDIHTADGLDKYLAVSDVYEMHKSVHGYRCSWEWLQSLTVEQLDQEMKDLQKESEFQAKRDAEMLQENIKKFNELITKTVRLGAGSFNNAIRWILDGADVNRRYKQDVETFLWSNGILHTNLGKRILKVR